MSKPHDEPQTNSEGIGRSVALPVLECGDSRAPMMGRTKRARWRASALILVNVLMIIHLIQWAIMGMTVSPVEPSEALIDRVGGRKIVDEHHGARAVAAKIETVYASIRDARPPERGKNSP